MHNMNAVFAAIITDAKIRRDTIAYSGGWGDGGSQLLLDQVKFFKYGRDKVFPPEWQTYLDQVTREQDPEYVEYQRLQKKFGK